MALLRSLTFLLMGLLYLSANSGCRKQSDIIPATIDPDTVRETNPPELLAVNKQLNAVTGGYYIALPSFYSKTKKSYPLFVFLHGLGQMGNGKEDLKYLLNDGIGKVLKDKKFPASFQSGAEQFSFIVVSPQFTQKPSIEDVISVVEELKANYRITEERIYLSGLSIGGMAVSNVAAAYPEMFAAIAPIAGVEIDSTVTLKCEKIASANLPVWVFHNEDDPMISLFFPKQFVSLINSNKPLIESRLTVFPVYGHDAWTMALDPSYKENGLNVYEWMLQYSR